MRVAGFDVSPRLVLRRDSLGSSSWRRITSDQPGDDERGEAGGIGANVDGRRRYTKADTLSPLKLSRHHDRLFAVLDNVPGLGRIKPTSPRRTVPERERRIRDFERGRKLIATYHGARYASIGSGGGRLSITAGYRGRIESTHFLLSRTRSRRVATTLMADVVVLSPLVRGNLRPVQIHCHEVGEIEGGNLVTDSPRRCERANVKRGGRKGGGVNWHCRIKPDS